MKIIKMIVVDGPQFEVNDSVYCSQYKCPQCSKSFVMPYGESLVDLIKFCPNCGIKILWIKKKEG